MTNKPIIVKASDFQYPSKVELNQVYKNTPDLYSFGFTTEDPMKVFTADERSIREVYRDDHLHYWDGVLLNRNGALSLTYQYAVVNYIRGFPDDVKLYEHHHYINRMHFDYYAEIFYYHFSTVKDTIAQILNIYYEFHIPTEKIYFNKEFIKKIPSQPAIEAIKIFLKETDLATKYRNSYTHRTPINYPDTRSTVKWEISELTYNSAAHSFVKSSVIKSNMDDTYYALAKILDTLKLILPQKIKD
jgi:hypothetical protein